MSIRDTLLKIKGIPTLDQSNILYGLRSQLNTKKNLKANEKINKRLELKIKNGEKINVVFVCHRPAIWASLKTVYEVLKNDSNFHVVVVAIPNKKELPEKGLNHEIYEWEGANLFFTWEDCQLGYDDQTQKWLDLKSLEPDYIFFQQPYNSTRFPEYKTWNVSKYAKILYVAYATDFIGEGVLEETTPRDYMRDVYTYFTQNPIDDKLIRNIFLNQKNTFTKTYMTGFPRYDELDQYIGAESNVWNYPKNSNHFRVMWTPRWCTNEGNCCFFDYKDKMVNYFIEHKEFDYVFRPHPQAFLNWNRTGELPEKEANKYIQIYEENENMTIDKNKEYFDTIYSSDCLISDTSSFIADYFMTGKPVIYCHKINMFNELSSKMSEGFYWVTSWDELKNTLEMLQSGEDPLQTRRLQILEELGLDKGEAGKKIKEYIIRDTEKRE